MSAKFRLYPDCKLVRGNKRDAIFAEKSEIGDGIKKEVKTRFPKDYYNTAYDTRLFKKRLFYKIICIKQML